MRPEQSPSAGSWPTKGRLYFHQDGSSPNASRPGTADFATDGTFQAGSFQRGGGLLPGKYKVTVECWESPPSMDKPQGRKKPVPPAFAAAKTTPLELAVELGKPQTDVRFDVPRK